MRSFFFTAVPVQRGPFSGHIFLLPAGNKELLRTTQLYSFFRNFLLAGKCERLFRILASMAASDIFIFIIAECQFSKNFPSFWEFCSIFHFIHQTALSLSFDFIIHFFVRVYSLLLPFYDVSWVKSNFYFYFFADRPTLFFEKLGP